ncbi:sulfurtransferase [Pseudonocardia petroleophila]|uniref:Sulfurtransferase n=1 Tax=Pseudonocardia petroleophila TaxID=37331 RepID=A0A7G7MHB2_9PSEU|nr:sulfurtransferase [Pseudonocardia petroleophila]QNG52173.1 sulfurtransferase [Pseudonocardia petroleophila]
MPAATSPLIRPAELAALLRAPSDAPRPVVIDVRRPPVAGPGGPPGREEYAAAHVPGSVYLDLDTDLASAPGPAGRHPLPEPGRLQDALRGAGVRDGSRVVVLDHGDATMAGRAWWLLRWAGLPAERVQVLDGGWAAWVAAGLPVTADPTPPVAGDVAVRPGGMPVLDADGAVAVVDADGVLLDARSGPRFRGETEPLDPVAGHVPGAVNLPAAELLGADGFWPSPAELAARLEALGVRAGAPVAAYCGSGVTAAALVLAAEHAGVRPPADPAALYVGSWSNWCALGRPVATGDAPAYGRDS